MELAARTGADSVCADPHGASHGLHGRRALSFREACGRDGLTASRTLQREGFTALPFSFAGVLAPAVLARPFRASYVTFTQVAFVLPRSSEPIFNVPAVVTALIVVLLVIHGLREWVLTPEADNDLLWLFAFVPVRYESSVIGTDVFPGGVAADVWTFVSYAFLHGSWTHLGLNTVWLLAFGTPVARRFGAGRFLLFFAVTAAGGALAHLLVNTGQRVPMIGASASISGFMAAAIRFAFQRGGPLRILGNTQDEAYRVPALPLTAVLRDPRVLIFLAVWFGLNLLFGLGSIGLDGGEQAIAWQAHIGGFLAGLIGFAAFDPVKASPPIDPGVSSDNPTIH
jgi:membrane associated rhomboid family serine protease